MLYYLIKYIEEQFHPPGFQVVDFITVRAALAAITALVVAVVLGPRLIRMLHRMHITDNVRVGTAGGVVDHTHKKGTPTMGGLIILIGVLGSTILWGAIAEAYMAVIMLSTIWIGGYGIMDDYLKIANADNAGMSARVKLVGQVGLGLVVGIILYSLPQFAEVRSVTDLPFVRDWRFDYNFLGRFFTPDGSPPLDLGWVVFIPVVVIVVTATSNAVNLTDGLDGLAASVTATVSVGLVVLCYVSGHSVLAEYLGVMYLPGAGELTVFAAAMAAACLGFLWFNCYPASVFMGDTGSLALGAAVGVIALMVKKELLLPLLCLVFLVEALSVIIQVGYFRYSRRRTGTGKRVFRMAPLHHHYEATGMHETKVVVRFAIVSVLAVITTLLTLRIQ